MEHYKPTKWEAKFLDLYSKSCNVTLSAKGAGIDRNTVYQRRYNYPTFATIMDDAEQQAIELLEAEAWQRARKTSDLLLIFLLKAHKPTKYREQKYIDVTSKGESLVSWADAAKAAKAALTDGSDDE